MTNATPEQVSDAVARAQRAFEDWSMTPAGERAACLERAADLLEGAQADVLALCIREAGKTIPDAVAELREAVDFCRYYADPRPRGFRRGRCNCPDRPASATRSSCMAAASSPASRRGTSRSRSSWAR